MLRLPPRYVVGRELGRGGMGIVYEAEDSRLGRRVAIKVLQTGQENPDRKRRFAQEARAASALKHPNIITIHDIDTTDDGDFIVMELVDGVPLSQLARGGPVALDRAIDYATQIAGALAASHAAGIVHRDLKPANVMVTRESVITVLDFGLSKWTAEPAAAADAATVTGAPYTQHGAILGTSGYMSPEQALGQAVDARSDVFSFGVVLYELLAGRRAFDGESEWSAMKALVHDQPTPLSEIRPDVPGALERIVDRCLDKDRTRRYGSGGELVDDLRRLAPATAPARSSRTARDFAVAAVVLAVLAGITWVMVRRWQSSAMVERSLPEIERLAGVGQYLDAYRLGERVARAAPGDPRVQHAMATATVPLNMNEPAGASVYFKGYTDADGPWQLLGRVPFKGVFIPMGQLRWRLVEDGFDAAEGASPNGPFITIRRAGEAPAGMVYVRGGSSQRWHGDGQAA